jgi:hypothetical protein
MKSIECQKNFFRGRLFVSVVYCCVISKCFGCVNKEEQEKRLVWGWGLCNSLQRIFLCELLIGVLIGSLLAGTRRPSHVAGVAGVETTQNVFSTQKDTASAQSLKETVQQRKKLGGTLRFGRYYLLPVTCIYIVQLSRPRRSNLAKPNAP